MQLENLEKEKERIDRLLQGGAATPKQQDDMADRIELLKAQTEAVRIQKRSVYAEEKSLDVQVEQVEEQIRKCTVTSPISGIMLAKYKEQGEIAIPGQPLYKMANLDQLILRAYVSGDQLSGIETGKAVTVRYDVPGGLEEISGAVSYTHLTLPTN